MTAMTPRLSIALGSLALLLVGVVGGVAIDRLTTRRAPLAPPSRQILYWYDPMVPGQHFDQPGRSPFMDMQLVPRYAGHAGNGSTSPGVVVDSGRIQTLGVRLATVRRGAIGSELTAFGVVDFNQRDVTIIQARATGFVQRVYGRAPGDTVRSGAPLADVLVPEWASAQSEYLAVRRTGDPRLIAAARQRLVLMGAPASLIDQAERSGRARSVITIVVPAGGVIRTLSIRSGMAITQGQTLAEINGIESVWLNAAIPEAQAAQVRVGQDVSASFAGFPGRSFTGRVSALLPEAAEASRTLTARVEITNQAGQLRPGMFATVRLIRAATPALLVPAEAVIRTGRRNLVILAQSGGRYLPAEVQLGQESANEVEILAGLVEGERIVSSGQFLIDSEASLSGVTARPISRAMTRPVQALSLLEGVGRIEQITGASVTLSHEAIPAAEWPAMTMTFTLPDRAVASGHAVGERVRFAFDRPGGVPTVRRIVTDGASQ